VEYGVLKLLLAEIANKHSDQVATAKLGVTEKNLLCQAIFGDCGFQKLDSVDVWRLVEFKPPSFRGAFEFA
jgi:hypothetical protein